VVFGLAGGVIAASAARIASAALVMYSMFSAVTVAPIASIMAIASSNSFSSIRPGDVVGVVGVGLGGHRLLLCRDAPQWNDSNVRGLGGLV
jgi:hypothetical protein